MDEPVEAVDRAMETIRGLLVDVVERRLSGVTVFIHDDNDDLSIQWRAHEGKPVLFVFNPDQIGTGNVADEPRAPEDE